MSDASALDAHRASYEHIYRDVGIRDDEGFYRWIVQLVQPRSGWRLLDIACGEGGLLWAAKTRDVDAVGVDISLEATKKALRQDGAAQVVLGNAEQLPLAAERFDCVTCLGSLENFGDPSAALAEVWRVLKPGARFCAMMPNKYFLGDVLQVATGTDEQVPFQHVERVATGPQWHRILERHGFHVEGMRGYVKRSPLIRNGKLRSVKKFVATRLLAWCSPPTLAWSLVFLCRKIDRPVLPVDAQGAWMWRAEWIKDETRSVS